MSYPYMPMPAQGMVKERCLRDASAPVRELLRTFLDDPSPLP